jgi:hypothetical protein
MNKQRLWVQRRALLAVAGGFVLATPRPGGAADAVAVAGGGVVTILDGEAQVVQGVAKFAVTEGMRLAPGDIVVTSGSTRLLRIEGPAGELMSLGPQTELMLSPRLAARGSGRAAPAAYLMRGWVKTNRGFASPTWDLDATGGELVASLQEGVNQVFVETGAASFQESGAAAQTLAAGTFVERRGAAKSVKGRPTPAFIAQMPRPFLDTLPLRAHLFAQAKPAGKALGAPSYGDLKAWLTAEPGLRQGLMRRWQPLVQGEFRSALEKNLVAHPEWERLLFPERFRPKVVVKTL